ncbi:HlyD family efflux transporter periplasmic adaptor subunit [Spirulina subsalsa FACHB-351]|uniref:HlyD family efflux transporter periplasmic adaptor subunit n=1 Tax=Spirulina subsalsa FACHB-351 TaxID=234711 RepID=A0ABT3L2J6_9CYAN|nr:HlyD family efflux transporter periplasmic adaptor subunit [Spirulina subsalsa]MCW6035693.1 HlyD family efflux transporter periplasmic adaptor subunit [Spirulina subsalsa FACHB-351]
MKSPTLPLLTLVSPQALPWQYGLFVVLLLVLGGGVLYWRQPWQTADSNALPVSTVERTTVTALGRLEPEGSAIQIHAPTASQERRLAELRVGLGDSIIPGQIIAVLDGRERLEAALEQAQSEVKIAQAQLAQIQAGAKAGTLTAQEAEIERITAERQAQITAQQSIVAERQAELDNAEAELSRYRTLYDDGAIAALDQERKQLARDTAQRRLETARAELSRLQTTQAPELQRARATLEQLAEVRTVDVQLAQAQIQRAQALVQQAQANLDQIYVRSPRGGVVLDIYTHAGEVVAPEGIIELGQTAQMVAIAEVYQSDIQAIRVGQKATITSPALPESLTGSVTQIGAKIQAQNVVNTDPSSNIDARVVEVTIRLDGSASEQASRFTNLQVEVQLSVK